MQYAPRVMDWLHSSTPIITDRQARFCRVFRIYNDTARQFLAELLGTYVLLVSLYGSILHLVYY